MVPAVRDGFSMVACPYVTLGHALPAENFAYHELPRAIHRVICRTEVEFDGPWVIPMNVDA
eukprot:59886-Alexandrium_andersonii.AAC.1